MNNNDNFKVFGLPDNDEFDAPDNKKMNSKNGLPNELDSLMKNLPEGAKNSVLAMFTDPSQLNDMLENIFNQFNSSMGLNLKKNNSQNLAIISNFLNQQLQEDSEDEEDEEEPIEYALGNIKWLQNTFGKVLYTRDENIYNNFLKKYGTDSTKYADQMSGKLQGYMTDLTDNFHLKDIKNMKYIMNNDKFILFFAEPKDITKYGYYIIFVEKDPDEFILYVPAYYNTFDVDIDENNISYPVLYDIDDERFIGIDKNTNELEFYPFREEALLFSINFALAERKKVLLSPVQFGTIKNIMPVINSDSQVIKIGTIISNESSEAILFKKDAEVDLNQKEFPLYLKFPQIITKNSLSVVAQIFFKTDFNNINLFKNVELNYDMVGNFFVDVDLKDF